ncbi:hypothetical protein HCU64_08415 [Methylobacterium sp. C25]|uniref:hypothetical protein n=1 Tax=Methylobacterium sp. C25 TaxID=2721622 RepID=UPI001F1A349F|nr:hypothetical protein [Methylobacterium sp. C25]MCE4223770.1 hypothetical protein [Methylobacterium sp. C25]
MPLIPAGRVVCGTLALLFLAGPVLAESRHGRERALHRQASATRLAPEVRYRDPRYVPPRRRAPHFGAPDFLINAYLPRNTDVPMYNEPPSRFPLR